MSWDSVPCKADTKAEIEALKQGDESFDAVLQRLLAAHAGEPDASHDESDDTAACERECALSADDVGAIVERKVDDALAEFRR